MLPVAGGDGVVHTWDLRTHRCIGRAVDEGCVRGTSLACSADMFATGSDAGVVNVHRRPAALTGAQRCISEGLHRSEVSRTSCSIRTTVPEACC